MASQTSAALRTGSTAFFLLLTLSLCHLCNDLAQSLLPAVYPLLKASFSLSFREVGLITLSYQLAASLLQPLIGYYTDKHPIPFSLPVGMCFTATGLFVISRAGDFSILLFGAALLGTGSSIFHPEASRVARLASGGRYGLAQSVFQVCGNLGTALGPLLAAIALAGHGQKRIAWFLALAPFALVLLSYTGFWYKKHLAATRKAVHTGSAHHAHLNTRQVREALAILLVLIFSKYIYLSSLGSYYTFYLISKFGLSVRNAQLHLFLFLAAVAIGTVLGGPIGDRIGRKAVIWGSILGCFPFTLALPYANLVWTAILSVLIGLILASAFSAIVVYGQELMPGRVGMVAGLFFGFMFGIGGLGAALLGDLADHTSIFFIYKICSYLPLMGLLTVFLPDLHTERSAAASTSELAAIAEEVG